MGNNMGKQTDTDITTKSYRVISFSDLGDLLGDPLVSSLIRVEAQKNGIFVSALSKDQSQVLTWFWPLEAEREKLKMLIDTLELFITKWYMQHPPFHLARGQYCIPVNCHLLLGRWESFEYHLAQIILIRLGLKLVTQAESPPVEDLGLSKQTTKMLTNKGVANLATLIFYDLLDTRLKFDLQLGARRWSAIKKRLTELGYYATDTDWVHYDIDDGKWIGVLYPMPEMPACKSLLPISEHINEYFEYLPDKWWLREYLGLA